MPPGSWDLNSGGCLVKRRPDRYPSGNHQPLASVADRLFVAPNELTVDSGFAENMSNHAIRSTMGWLALFGRHPSARVGPMWHQAH